MFYFGSILAAGNGMQRRGYDKLANENLNLSEGPNQFAEVQKDLKKKRRNELIEKAVSFKTAMKMLYGFAALIIVLVIIGYVYPWAFKGHVPTADVLLLGILCLVVYTGIACLFGWGIACEGLREVNLTRNRKIEIDADSFVYSYITVDPMHNEDAAPSYIFINKMVMYSDIDTITYDDKQKMYEICCKEYLTEQKSYLSTQKPKTKVEEGKRILIANMFDEETPFTLIAEKSGKEILRKKVNAVTHKAAYIAAIVFFICFAYIPFVIFLPIGVESLVEMPSKEELQHVKSIYPDAPEGMTLEGMHVIEKINSGSNLPLEFMAKLGTTENPLYEDVSKDNEYKIDCGKDYGNACRYPKRSKDIYIHEIVLKTDEFDLFGVKCGMDVPTAISCMADNGFYDYKIFYDSILTYSMGGVEIDIYFSPGTISVETIRIICRV